LAPGAIRASIEASVRFLVALLVGLGLAAPAPEALAAKRTRGRARAHHAAPRAKRPPSWTRVAVQPIAGPGGPALRAQVVRMLRRRGYPVITSLPAVSGTAQYPGMARDRRVAAFVVAELAERPGRNAATFLVWHGDSGDVADRWTVAAHPKKLPLAVARGFWRELGGAIGGARPPAGPRTLPPARPMRIDAGDPIDEPIVSGNGFSRGGGARLTN
jgi:hypothetical protein